MQFKKALHLLYAPTAFCNMSCKYCYLGELTEQRGDGENAIKTLEHALDKLLGAGYLPFNLSLHGGEVTTLPPAVLDKLLEIAAQHYQNYGEKIQAMGFRVSPPHIKTNLLNFKKHQQAFLKHKVSISGSVDLPLTLHDKYRRDKKGDSTLERIKENLALLAHYPHHRKISCVVTQEHLQMLDEFAADIRFLHDDLGLDMSKFNIMFGFDSPLNQEKFAGQNAGTKMLDDAGQLRLYRYLQREFKGSSLETAFRTDWFKEFTPDYCCSAVNCGDKFFLLQANGDVYSCPRGQSSTNYCYGNLFADEIDDIISNGWKTIERNENKMSLDDDCMCCEYLTYCNLGCTFVREATGLKKSYTCELQKLIYQDNPERYPPLPPEKINRHAQLFLLRNQIAKLETKHTTKQAPLTSELFAPENRLSSLIEKDPILQELYSESLFFLEIDGTRYNLRSGILKNEHDLEQLNKDSKVLLGIRTDALDIACDYAVSNHLYIMLLRDTLVVYGDEQRSKQEHIFEYALYRNALDASAQRGGDYWLLDISKLLQNHAEHYLPGVKNNLFFTTKTLREYHYVKHRKNAFYHVQAINLPFQNIEFFWQHEEKIV